MEPVILSGAGQDIQSVYAGLLEHSESRANLFLETLDRTLATLLKQPGMARLFPGTNLRSITPNPFPYRLFCKIEGMRLMVGAILDTRQDPAALIKQLRQRTSGAE
ncbi:MAG TPA: type II toxin-antitoxin system RelE/ParE family toxin [Verrucomicrobiales bacterium]|nr:type II toxin-antitoxin system RelE/ParE family toxin [Verrucomicrobiales bacterium]